MKSLSARRGVYQESRQPEQPRPGWFFEEATTDDENDFGMTVGQSEDLRKSVGALLHGHPCGQIQVVVGMKKASYVRNGRGWSKE